MPILSRQRGLWLPKQVPVGPVEIDPTHPLAPALATFVLAASRVDVTRTVALTTIASGGATYPSIAGPAWGKGSGGSNDNTLSGLCPSRLQLQAGTLAWGGAYTALSPADNLMVGIFVGGGGSPYHRISLYSNANANGVMVAHSYAGGFAPIQSNIANSELVGGFQQYAVTFQPGTGKSFLNGVVRDTALNFGTGAISYVSSDFFEMGDNSSTTQRPVYGAIFNRTLTDREIAQFHADPFALLRPLGRRNYRNIGASSVVASTVGNSLATTVQPLSRIISRHGVAASSKASLPPTVSKGVAAHGVSGSSKATVPQPSSRATATYTPASTVLTSLARTVLPSSRSTVLHGIAASSRATIPQPSSRATATYTSASIILSSLAKTMPATVKGTALHGVAGLSRSTTAMPNGRGIATYTATSTVLTSLARTLSPIGRTTVVHGVSASSSRATTARPSSSASATYTPASTVGTSLATIPQPRCRATATYTPAGIVITSLAITPLPSSRATVTRGVSIKTLARTVPPSSRATGLQGVAASSRATVPQPSAKAAATVLGIITASSLATTVSPSSRSTVLHGVSASSRTVLPRPTTRCSLTVSIPAGTVVGASSAMTIKPRGRGYALAAVTQAFVRTVTVNYDSRTIVPTV